MNLKPIGLGCSKAQWRVYVANRPNMPEFKPLTDVQALVYGDIQRIVSETGNHWRKIFNLYAKIMFELHPTSASSWQQYRDQYLLQNNQKSALLFSEPNFTLTNQIHIVAGKTHAQNLGLWAHCQALEEGFYINVEKRLIVSPYFDYRALSNIKVQYLINLVRERF